MLSWAPAQHSSSRAHRPQAGAPWASWGPPTQSFHLFPTPVWRSLSVCARYLNACEAESCTWRSDLPHYALSTIHYPLSNMHHALFTTHYPICTMHSAQGAQAQGGQTYAQLDMPTWPTRHVTITIIIKTSTSPLQLAHPCWQNPNGDPISTLLCFFEEHNKVANIISNKFQ